MANWLIPLFLDYLFSNFNQQGYNILIKKLKMEKSA